MRSRRWAAEGGLAGAALDAANNARLVRELHGLTDRRARFVCAAAFYDGVHEIVRVGAVEGTIVDAPRGQGGFGYDAHFVASELGMTLAELSVEEKGTVSHRARAFQALIAELRAAG